MGAESAVYDCLVVIVAASNPTTNRLLSKLLADPDELVTEPVIRTSETVDAQIELRLQKVIEMVCTAVINVTLIHVGQPDENGRKYCSGIFTCSQTDITITVWKLY